MSDRTGTPFPTYRGAKRPKVRISTRRRIYALGDHSCQECGVRYEPTGDDHAPYLPVNGYLVVDHIIPVSSGRVEFHDESNMRALCERCNMRKGARV